MRRPAICPAWHDLSSDAQRRPKDKRSLAAQKPMRLKAKPKNVIQGARSSIKTK